MVEVRSPKPKKAKRTPEEKAARERARKAEAEAAKIEQRRKKLEKAEVAWDPRTAQGRRNFSVQSDRGEHRAVIDNFADCFPERKDRTEARVLAWSAFAEHYQMVTVGEIKNPSYERGVDCSTTPGHVAEARLHAIKVDGELRAWVGGGHRLLVCVIHEGHALEQIGGDRQTFALVLDRAAAFFRAGGYRLPDGAIQRMETHLEALARAGKRQFSYELARTMVLEDGASVRRLQEQFGLTYREAYTVHANIRSAKSDTLARWEAAATTRAKRGTPYLG